MKIQRDVHEDSWESRKPDQDVVAQKPRVKATVSLLQNVINNGDRVFDLGCGDGTMGLLLDPRDSIKIDGCDISETAVNRASEHYRNVSQLNIDDADLPIDSSTYDLVICTDVLEHTLSPTHALQEIQRILRDDGTAVISVPNYGFIRYRFNSLMGEVPSIVRDKRHYSTFTLSYLQELLNDSQLEIQSTTGVSRLQKLARAVPSAFGKTIIVTATVQY